jgi:CTP-dependent riboflavin kinase
MLIFKIIKKGLTLSQGIIIRPFQKSHSDKVIEFISDIIVNEFKFKLD